MPATTRGVPFPFPSSHNNVPADIEALATWVNNNPGIPTLTTTQRDALAGAGLWTGKLLFNTTTGRYEGKTASGWRPVQFADTDWISYTPTYTGSFTLGAGGATSGGYYLVGTKGPVYFRAQVTLGTGFTIGAAPGVSLPLRRLGAPTDNISGFLYDASDTTYMAMVEPTATDVRLYSLGASGRASGISSTSPFTFVAGDALLITGTYQPDPAYL